MTKSEIDIAEGLALGYAHKYAGRKWPAYDGTMLDRSKYVTSSEVLNCARRIKFEKAYLARGESIPFPNWGYAERGVIIEEWVVDMLERADYRLLYAGDEQASFYLGAQSGTPDGLVENADGTLWLLEFKSIDPRTHWSNLPKPNHVAQVQQNIDLAAACLDTGIAGGILFYIDASNLRKSKQFDIEADHDYAEQLQKRAESILQAASPAELPSEGIYNGDCDRCLFTAECSRMVAGDYADLQDAGKGVFK